MVGRILVVYGNFLSDDCFFRGRAAVRESLLGRKIEGGLSSSTFSIDAIRRVLHELSYVKEQHRFRAAKRRRQTERLPTLADELASLKVDLSSLRVVVMVTGDRGALQGIAELRNNIEKRCG